MCRGRAPVMRPLPADGVDLWLADPAVCRQVSLRRAYEALLNENERAQHRRFVFEADRDRYLLTRVLVRTVLAEYTGVAPTSLVFETNAWGKPALRGAEAHLSFNVSHATNGPVVLAVSSTQLLGVDLEDTRRAAPLGVADRFFSPIERAALFALPPTERPLRFWTLWTLKESFVKALGMGLHQPLDSFVFDLGLTSEERDIGFTAPAGTAPCRWWFGSCRASPEHLLALCITWDKPSPPLLRARYLTPLQAMYDLWLTMLRATSM
jgi:4'-phosphopantetheinyl transferase